jgi:hypothetical protein
MRWLIRDGFYEQVTNVWNSENKGTNSLQGWEYKIRHTREFLRGWAKHIKGKKRLSHSVLSSHEHDLLRYLKDRISHSLREGEIAWLKRYKKLKNIYRVITTLSISTSLVMVSIGRLGFSSWKEITHNLLLPNFI